MLKKVAGDEKQDDDDGDVDPATEDMDICGSEKPSENPNKDKGNEEEEEEDQETAKNAKGKESKKKLASTTPKASPNKLLLDTYLPAYLPTYHLGIKKLWALTYFTNHRKQLRRR